MSGNVILSDKVFSPQEYLELVTGKYFQMTTESNAKTIKDIFKQEKISYVYDYALSDIVTLLNGCKSVVLVCLFEPETGEHVYRWYEVPANAIANFDTL